MCLFAILIGLKVVEMEYMSQEGYDKLVAELRELELLTSSSCHPKIFVKEFSYFLMSCHQHCLGVNLLVQR